MRSLAVTAAISMANILRVMRGGGRSYEVASNFEDVAEKTIGLAAGNDRGNAVTGIAKTLSEWRSPNESYGAPYLEDCVIDAALRVLAARMDGNRMEETKGKRELKEVIDRYANEMIAERDSQVNERIKSQVYRRDLIDRFEAVTQKRNARIASTANSNICYVYFITDGEKIKIGKAGNPRMRLSGLQTSHHKPLYFLAIMPGDESVERQLHRIFYAHRIRGEWFNDCEEIRRFIATVRKDFAAANDNLSVPELNAA